jgi:hypothetical protein
MRVLRKSRRLTDAEKLAKWGYLRNWTLGKFNIAALSGSSAPWQREVGDFQIEWGLPEYHEGSLWCLVYKDGQWYRGQK